VTHVALRLASCDISTYESMTAAAMPRDDVEEEEEEEEEWMMGA
jgi:hypothetical protein